MAMNENDFVYKELEHIRMIHFSITAIAITIISLVLSSWNDAPEIYENLQELKTFSRLLSQEDVKLSQLQNYSSLINKFNLQQVTIKSAEGQHPLNTEKTSLDQRSRIVREKAVSAEATINGIIASISNEPWLAQVITDIDIGTGLSEECVRAIEHVTKKEQEHISIIPTKPTQSEGVFASTRYYKRDTMSISLLQFNEVGWPRGKESVASKALLRLEIKLAGYDAQKIPNDDGKLRYWTTRFEQVAQCATWSSVSIVNFSLNADFRFWFDHKLPTLTKNRSKIGNLTIDQLFIWLKTERLSGIAQQKPSFLGITFGGHGELIIVAGLFAMIACFFYLIEYLSQLSYYVGTFRLPGFLSPWIVSRRGYFSQAVAVITLSLLPTISLVLTLWRLFGMWWPALCLASLLCLALGVASHLRSVTIMRQLGEQRLS